VIITAEVVAASAVVLLASAMLSAYVADWIGLTIAPSAVLVVSLAASAGTFAGLWRRAARDRSSLAAFLVIVAAVMAWLLWLAGRDLLPPGTGPDLTHHLLLVGYIEEHWRLPHDPQLGPFLGEMVDYTPGAHLLAALAGAWTRTDGLHAVYPLVAFTVALKCGLVFLITRRLVRSDVPRIPFAVMAVLLLLLPRAYFTGSFAQHSFLAQVVAEVFAVALWWALVIWDARPGMLPIAFFAIVGAATFLTWPVWIGPPVVMLTICLASRRDVSAVERAKQFMPRSRRDRRRRGGIRGLSRPLGRDRGGGGLRSAAGAGGLRVGVSARVWRGRVRRALRTAHTDDSAVSRRDRPPGRAPCSCWRRRAGSAAPYLALKMVYLAIYPLAVAGAAGTAIAWQTMVRAVTAGIGDSGIRPGSDPGLTPRADRTGSRGVQILQWSRTVSGCCWPCSASSSRAPPCRSHDQRPPSRNRCCAPVGGRAPTRTPGAWTISSRTATPRTGCTWQVLGNARAAARSLENDTYELPPALVRWIEPGGLPYAIVEDYSALPKDIRDNVDVAARFGRTAVVKRRGAVSCAP
jgi:hypothetical protein